jgi:catechol 2,3-dioxygenase-like lactoylglutathione lyase family enzyme
MFSHIFVGTSNFERAVAFYRQLAFATVSVLGRPGSQVLIQDRSFSLASPLTIDRMKLETGK